MVGGALILFDQITDVSPLCVATCRFLLFICEYSAVFVNNANLVKMSDKCKSCNRVTKQRQVKIKCNDCDSLFHGSCVNMSEEDVTFMQAENEIFRCDNCKKTRRESMRFESAVEKSGGRNNDVIMLLREMQEDSKKQFKHLEDELGNSVENCHAGILELRTMFDEQSKIIKAYEEKFEAMSQENTHLKKRVKALESELDNTEQYSRVNCLELNGIPETKTENVYDVIKSVGNALGMDITEEQIDACHRMGSKQEGKKRGIIVKFTRRTVKEEMLSKRKVKRNFNTHDLGFRGTAADVVYINESLTPVRRKILNAARALKKEKGYTYVWVKNGRIFLRKNDGDPAIVATSVEQLASL